MLGKHQASLAHPKNVTVNVLDGNSFFSLDYELPQRIDPMTYTLNSFLGKNNNNQVKQHMLKNGTPNFNITNYAQTAQYSRKMLQPTIVNRMSINPYIRIRRVDEIIKQNKVRQTSFDKPLKSKLQQIYTTLPAVVDHKTDRSNRSEQRQKFIKSLTIDPQRLAKTNYNQEYITKKYSKTINAYSQNYKNRRKLVDKATHNKNIKISPLRCSTKPKNLQQKQLLQAASLSLQKSQQINSYRDRLNKANDPLLHKIQGNRIKYTLPQPKVIKVIQQGQNI